MKGIAESPTAVGPYIRAPMGKLAKLLLLLTLVAKAVIAWITCPGIKTDAIFCHINASLAIIKVCKLLSPFLLDFQALSAVSHPT